MEVLSGNLQENFDRFIVESLQHGCVWGLRDKNDNWALVRSGSSDAVDVIPFWSAKKLASDACIGQWNIYFPVAIDINEFLDDWLPGMHNDVLLVGVNWNVDLQGEEIEPLDLLEEFEEELD
jgi:hypothetical protein